MTSNPEQLVVADAESGLTFNAPGGGCATLALIDEAGHVVASGPVLVEEVWTRVLDFYEAFLRGEGAIRRYLPPDASARDPARRSMCQPVE